MTKLSRDGGIDGEQTIATRDQESGRSDRADVLYQLPDD